MKKPLISLCVLLLLASCGGDEAPGKGAGGTIDMIAGQRFDPDEIGVVVGDTVVWTNESSETHTVTAYEDDAPEGADYFASGGFGSEDDARSNLSDGLIDPGETFEVTFDEPGTYKYFCLPHEGSGMKGTIIVK